MRSPFLIPTALTHLPGSSAAPHAPPHRSLSPSSLPNALLSCSLPVRTSPPQLLLSPRSSCLARRKIQSVHQSPQTGVFIDRSADTSDASNVAFNKEQAVATATTNPYSHPRCVVCQSNQWQKRNRGRKTTHLCFQVFVIALRNSLYSEKVTLVIWSTYF